jgi:hypothetical protein
MGATRKTYVRFEVLCKGRGFARGDGSFPFSSHSRMARINFPVLGQRSESCCHWLESSAATSRICVRKTKLSSQNPRLGLPGVRGVRNPVLLVRAVMEKSEHVFLIGEGAERFAREPMKLIGV